MSCPEDELAHLAARGAREVVDGVQFLRPLLPGQARALEVPADLAEAWRVVAVFQAQDGRGVLAEPFVRSGDHRDFRDPVHAEQQFLDLQVR